MSARDDERLRAVFEVMKDHDARERTTYAAVSARAVHKRARLTASPVLRLAAAGIVIASVVTAYRVSSVREAQLAVPREVTALMAWRPETDVLLASPNELLKSQTGIRGSMIDLDTLITGALR